MVEDCKNISELIKQFKPKNNKKETPINKSKNESTQFKTNTS